MKRFHLNKQRIAREWLIFLTLVALSPIPVGFVEWLNEPEVVFFASPCPKPTADDLLKSGTTYSVCDGTYPSDRDYVFFNTNEFWKDLDKDIRLDKRSFWAFLPRQMAYLPAYLSILYTYPVYLFACSILWAVRTLRKRVAS